MTTALELRYDAPCKYCGGKKLVPAWVSCDSRECKLARKAMLRARRLAKAKGR